VGAAIAARDFKREGICARQPAATPPRSFQKGRERDDAGEIRVGSPFRTPPGTLPRSIRESDQVDAGTSSRGIAGSPSPIMEPRNACRFTKFNVQGRNRGIPPIDELSEHRFAAGGQLCAEQRPLRGSTGVPLRLANFRRTATIPSKKKEFKEVERRWLSQPATASVTASNLRSDVLTLLVVSRDDGAYAVFLAASLSYGPRPHLYTGSLPLQ
jgi:hypothetical protein